MKLSSLSILIPAYKDEKTIETVITRSVAACKKFSRRFEILVINDASPDATGEVLKRLQTSVPQLRVITHKQNRGYGGTVKHLYTTGKYDWLFCAPGDNQMDPMEISKLLLFVDTADMIIGRRIDRQDIWQRRLQSRIYNGLLRFLFGIHIHDVNSVRLMKREMVCQKLLTAASAFVDAQLTIQAVRMGFRVIEVPINHQVRITIGASGGKASVIVPVIWEMIQYRIKTFL